MFVGGDCAKFFTSHAALPPSYDDIVGAVPPAGSGAPSAPPLSHVPELETPLMAAYHNQPGYNGKGDTSEQSRRGVCERESSECMCSECESMCE